MVWSRWVEDTISHIFYMYDIKSKTEQQKKLKRICINELHAHPEIKAEIRNDKQMEYFVVQMALESIQ